VYYQLADSNVRIAGSMHLIPAGRSLPPWVQVESDLRTHPFHDRRFLRARCGHELLLRDVIVPQIAEIFHVTLQRYTRRSNGESVIISMAYFATRARNRVTHC
jgi:hypothetical protein